MKQALFLSLLLGFSLQQTVFAQRDFSDSPITKLVLLGTGNPNPSPEQSGCALTLVVNGTPYIVDFGPGLIRKAAAMTPRYGGKIEGLEADILVHEVYGKAGFDASTEEELLKEIRSGYGGEVIVGRDLDIF